MKRMNNSGAFWNMMGSTMMSANTVLMTMFVGQLFSLEDVGRFTLSLTTAQVLYAVGLFGVNDMQMTDYDHRFAFEDYLWVKIFSTILAAVSCVVFLMISKPDMLTRAYTQLLTVFMLINSGAELFQAFYFQNRRIDLSGKSLFWRYFVSTVTFVISIVYLHSIFYAVLLMLLSDLLTTLWWARLIGQFHEKDKKRKNEVRQLLKEGSVLCLCLLGSLLLINVPRYLLRSYYNDELQGIYSLLFMPTYAVSLLGQFIFKPFLYRYKKALESGRRQFMSLLKKHLLIIAELSFIGAFCMWLLGPFFLKILFGQNLSSYRNQMFLFLLSGGVLAVNQLLYYLMILSGKRKEILIIYIIAIGTMITAGVLAIPPFGISGVWICFTIGQIVLLTGYLFELFRVQKKLLMPGG